jgi:hypothetical protein
MRPNGPGLPWVKKTLIRVAAAVLTLPKGPPSELFELIAPEVDLVQNDLPKSSGLIKATMVCTIRFHFLRFGQRKPVTIHSTVSLSNLD